MERVRLAARILPSMKITISQRTTWPATTLFITG